MSKTLIAFLAIFVFFFLLAPFSSFAKTEEVLSNDQFLKIIQQIQEQIKSLQNQITKLQGELGVTPTKTPKTEEEIEEAKTAIEEEEETKEPKIEILKLTKNLFLGNSGEEVRNLQMYLAKDKEIYPESLITGYFGPLTQTAVKRWQEKHGITAIGIVGPKTRKKFLEIKTETRKRGKETIRHFIEEEDGAPTVIPPGLLKTPGIQKKLEAMATTTAPVVVSPQLIATTTTAVATTTITATTVQTTQVATTTVATTTATTTEAQTSQDAGDTTSTQTAVSTQTQITTQTQTLTTQTTATSTNTSQYDSSLNLSGISNIFEKIWGPGSNGIILGSGLNFSTQVGVGWSQQYEGKYVTSYSIQYNSTQTFLTLTTPLTVSVTGPANSIIEVWDLENLQVVATNISNPGSPTIFTAQPSHRYGGFAWYTDNSQKNILISASSAVTATTTPITPSNLTYSLTNGNTTVVLNWTDNSVNETRFEILKRVQGSFTYLGQVGANVTTFSESPSAGSHEYNIQACNGNAIGDGCSYNPPSVTATVNAASTTDTIPPSVPTGVYLSSPLPGYSSVNLYWSASTDNIGVAGYKVYQNGIFLLEIPSTLSTSVGNLSNAYSYSVAAFDAAGNISTQTLPVSATTQTSQQCSDSNGACLSATTTTSQTSTSNLASILTSLENILKQFQTKIRNLIYNSSSNR